jgi:hypothetical protein
MMHFTVRIFIACQSDIHDKLKDKFHFCHFRRDFVWYCTNELYWRFSVCFWFTNSAVEWCVKMWKQITEIFRLQTGGYAVRSCKFRRGTNSSNINLFEGVPNTRVQRIRKETVWTPVKTANCPSSCSYYYLTYPRILELARARAKCQSFLLNG